ncbi:MAG: PqqD family protein [Rhodospirillaceae bacterium]|nr:PqqD family protein [Rhodospirillaceae bacterium]
MSIDSNATIALSPDWLCADVGGEMVLMSVEHGLYLSLDTIGRDIWKRLESPCTVRGLCDALVCDYEAPRDVIEADILDLLSSLAEVGAVVVR